jgi:hypothetical protein
MTIACCALPRGGTANSLQGPAIADRSRQRAFLYRGVMLSSLTLFFGGGASHSRDPSCADTRNVMTIACCALPRGGTANSLQGPRDRRQIAAACFLWPRTHRRLVLSIRRDVMAFLGHALPRGVYRPLLCRENAQLIQAISVRCLAIADASRRHALRLSCFCSWRHALPRGVMPRGFMPCSDSQEQSAS